VDAVVVGRDVTDDVGGFIVTVLVNSVTFVGVDNEERLG
jgi:hypothetical protein